MHGSVVADVKEALPFHQHKPHELIICAGNNGLLEVAGVKYDYRVGRTFLIPSNVSHRVIGFQEQSASTQFICFDDAFAASLGLLPLSSYLTTGCLRHSVASHYHGPSFRENLRLGRKLQQELDNPTKFSHVLCKSLLTQVLVNHCRLTRIPDLVVSNSKHFRIEKCCDYILQDPARVITLENMAEMAGMSRSYFSQQFKKVTGKSLIEYITLVRLQTACQLLRHGNDPATSIAFACGFGNLGHFYSVFKKQYQMTPLDYRQWATQQQGPKAPDAQTSSTS